MKPIKVILVDDHSLVRAGIRSLIQYISGVEVIAEANNLLLLLSMPGLHIPH